MRKNITTDSDIYKFPKFKTAHPDLEGVYSYGEPRIGARYKEICFFGMSMIIQDHFMQRVTESLIKEGEERIAKRVGFDNMFNRGVWEKVKDLGYLPIRIMAAPEGKIVETGNVCFTIQETQPFFAPMVQFLESSLMHVWYPTEIASRAYHIKKGVLPTFLKSCDNGNTSIGFAVNDFGYRGATCHEAAGRGGAGHLVHFTGSDNEAAMTALIDYYNCHERLMSVWATEHSDALSFGPNNELDYVKHQLKNSDPDQIVSIVTDCFDQDNFFLNVACHPEIVDIVKGRQGKVMWRPDRGVPLVNVCKYSDILGATYGFHMNTKGYKSLDNGVGILQGDGMNEDSIPELYTEYIKTGWAADNVFTGSGGGLLQADVARDNQRWAIKPSHMIKAGIGYDVFKSGSGDVGKESKSGYLKLQKNMTIQSSKESPEQFDGYMDELEVVFEDGAFKRQDFSEIIKRARPQI